jgi:hypothetical protein
MNPHSSASAINIYENTANGYALENRSEIVSGIFIYIKFPTQTFRKTSIFSFFDTLIYISFIYFYFGFLPLIPFSCFSGGVLP